MQEKIQGRAAKSVRAELWRSVPCLLREEAAELLAMLPAARCAAAGGPAGGEAALDGVVRGAYRLLRLIENTDALAALTDADARPEPVCLSALAAAYMNGAAGVCRRACFSVSWPSEPVWTPGSPRLFAAVLGGLVAEAVADGGERPAVGVRLTQTGHTALLAVSRAAKPDARPVPPSAFCENAGMEDAGAASLCRAVARRYAAWCGGRLFRGGDAEENAFAALRLPVCSAAAPRPVPDYTADRFSPLYVQLAEVCDLPL